MISSSRKTLVLAAHPDDAEISVGGLIARLTHQKSEVVVVNCTTSEYSVEGKTQRRRAAHQAAEILGHKLLWIEGGEHDQVEQLPEYRLVTLIDSIIEAEQPDTILAPWTGDSHTDHTRLARATLSSSRRWTADLYAYCPPEYRTICFHRFEPNVFVDISLFVNKKISAIRQFNYAGQGFRVLEENNLRCLWSYYGTLSGFEVAEGLLGLRIRIT